VNSLRQRTLLILRYIAKFYPLKNIAIHISHLSKSYRRRAAVPNSLRGAISALFKPGYGQIEEFKALDDISLDIKSGEVLGIIGPNGAGKSTLLKILARISAPTSGRVELWGKVGALLEIGTGFHPEMSGRENVFMNGSILGMSRNEIKDRFDEIVDFSGIGGFIDTPVKHYSTGMQLRLGFAVAAHLNPDILLIDEVLAVGDLEFRQKCMGKMDEISQKQGRTILFVSHSLPSVSKLCRRCILLENGKISIDGEPEGVIWKYEQSLALQTKMIYRADSHNLEKDVYIREAGIIEPEHLHAGGPLELWLRLRATSGMRPVVVMGIYSSLGEKIARLSNQYSAISASLAAKEIQLNCRIEELPLVPGLYYVNVAVLDAGNELERIEKILSFSIQSGRLSETDGLKEHDGSKILLKQEWTQHPV
jgi:lipopolysaccharide transport system ATP-binding protein